MAKAPEAAEGQKGVTKTTTSKSRPTRLTPSWRGAMWQAVQNGYGYQLNRGGEMFDGARQDEPDIFDHYYYADGNTMSPDAQVDETTRQVLRSRARFEASNNPWLKGMGKTYKNDLVGTTPRLQVTDDRLSSEVQRDVERKFSQWMKDVQFARKFRTQAKGKQDDGEMLGVIFDYEGEDAEWFKNPVKLGYRIFEPDRLQDYMSSFSNEDSDYKEGIKYNRYGDPVEYRILKVHPGARHPADLLSAEKDPYLYAPAERVIHWFDPTRVEQNRGHTEWQSVLRTAALFRQYKTAIVRTVRNAARFFPVLKTSLPPANLEQTEITLENGDKEIVSVQERCETGMTMPLNDDLATALPDGYDLEVASAPDTRVDDDQFTRTSVGEMGRSVGLPSNKAIGNSDKTSYAGGRLDLQEHKTNICIDRFDLNIISLDKVFNAWWDAAILIEGYLDESARNLAGPEDHPPTPQHGWHWDGFPPVDELKSANATLINLRTLTTTPEREWARQGSDFDTELQSFARSLGVEPEELQRRFVNFLWPEQTVSPDKQSGSRGTDGTANTEAKVQQLEAAIADLTQRLEEQEHDSWR